jgi:hypothetical protein
MAKLTKKQANDLWRIVSHFERALNYMNGDRVVVALKDDMATTTLHYTRADGSILYPIAKDIGSDLAGLSAGLHYLKQFVRMGTE